MGKILATTLVCFSLVGCSTNQWWPGIDSQKLCDESKKQKFLPDGHVNTTHIITTIAGIDSETSERYALFSQVPDAQSLRFSAPAVSVYGTLLWGGDYRHEIAAILHSLHGGDNQQVKDRRLQLQKLIRQYVALHARENDWKIGFLIHALGDSYAHVYSEGGDSVRAYGPAIGHLIEKGNFAPDSIRQNLDNYILFTKALFDAMGGVDKQRYDEYITIIRKVVAESKRDDDVSENIAIENLKIAHISYACFHKTWVDKEINRTDVDLFLKSIRKELESNSNIQASL